MTPPQTCSPLPSITDLLAPECTESPKPLEITPADTAYLRALYGSSLEANPNIEQGDVRAQMINYLEGR